MLNKIYFLTVLILIILTIPSQALTINDSKLEKLDFKILNSYQHDPEAFTQGLEIYKGYLYEGTGLYNKSSLRKIDFKNNKILKKINLNPKYFGEGITILNDKIYQLSWKENTAFVYDLNFNLINKFYYQGQGWGLTNNGQYLIMSNGSFNIQFRNPKDFSLVRKITVQTTNQKITEINELEYHNGFIYANIWHSDLIIKINAKNGLVKSYLDLTGILKTDYKGEIDVLNGIAYHPQNNSFLITGKFWPKLYQIKIKKSLMEKN